MKLLQEIASFPDSARKTLETQYGIESAEAFYAHTVKDSAGLRTALGIPQLELDKLIRLVEAISPRTISNDVASQWSKTRVGVIVD